MLKQQKEIIANKDETVEHLIVDKIESLAQQNFDLQKQSIRHNLKIWQVSGSYTSFFIQVLH